ncbi:hypothetical protein [Streptomyces werraensis]|uniref:hypothetical protein n=1 Tax=Streptomyces werraensis TaxID=68284 RepID=UPI0037D800F1
MDTMTCEDLEGAEFRDTYTEAVHEIIEAKREHGELPAAPEPAEPERVVGVMAALQESVQKAKTSRGEDAEVYDLPKSKETAAKSSGRKSGRSA